METTKKPAASYIYRGLELESLQARIPMDLKAEVAQAANKLDTSLNRFVEAALHWYLEELKKEGSL